MQSQSDYHYQHNLLLVEDDLVDQELVRRKLGQIQRPRFEIDSASTLSEALDKLNRFSFDAVILDLNLPDCRSLESVDQLREAWPAGPIIVLTGHDEESSGIDAIRHGASDYLEKDGLSATLLSRTISHSIERRRMEYWIKATEDSKDEYLADVCVSLKETLSELLIATSVLVGNDDHLDSTEMKQVEAIITCGKRMSQLIDDATPPKAVTQADNAIQA